MATDQMSKREIARVLDIPVSDVDKPLTAEDIVALKPLYMVDKDGEPIGPMRLDTWWSYVTRAKREREAGRDRPGLAPEPDGRLGRTPYWMPATIAAYKRTRPGQGKGGGRPSHRG